MDEVIDVGGTALAPGAGCRSLLSRGLRWGHRAGQPRHSLMHPQSPPRGSGSVGEGLRALASCDDRESRPTEFDWRSTDCWAGCHWCALTSKHPARGDGVDPSDTNPTARVGLAHESVCISPGPLGPTGHVATPSSPAGGPDQPPVLRHEGLAPMLISSVEHR